MLQIQLKKLSTVVKVKGRLTIILGGLITNNKGVENSSVPLLSSIPFLGEAFKHSADTLSTTELVFVITPRIIGAKGTDKAATLKDLGFSQKVYEYTNLKTIFVDGEMFDYVNLDKSVITYDKLVQTLDKPTLKLILFYGKPGTR